MKRTAPQGNAMAMQTTAGMTANQVTHPASGRGRTPMRDTTTSYLRKDVEGRVFELASSREQETRKWTVKLRPPSLYAMHDQPASLFDIPEDVLNLIIRKCDPKAGKFLGLSCRAGYRYVDTLDPLRRLPGLIDDLERLREKNRTANPDSVAAFLDALEAKDGEYDRVLLTPLSPAVRCAAGVAVLLWTRCRLQRAKDQDEMDLVNLYFVEENYDAGFLPAIETLLPLVRINKTSAEKRTKGLNLLFRSDKITVENKLAIFRKLLELAQKDICDYSSLSRIADENKLPLTLRDIGILALMNDVPNIFLPRLPGEYAKVPATEFKSAAYFFLDVAIKAINEATFPRDKIVFFRNLLDVIGVPAAIDNRLCLKMISLLEVGIRDYKVDPEFLDSLFYGMPESKEAFSGRFDARQPKRVFSPFDPLSSRSRKETFSYGLFAYMLIDKICQFKDHLHARTLISGIHAAVQKKTAGGINFTAYIQEKIASLK